MAVCLLWRGMLNDTGLINECIVSVGHLVGAEWIGPAWLSSTAWAKPAIMMMTLWSGIGGVNMILYIAALQAISKEYYEAAAMDGAGWWHQFWHITWPLVTPTTFFIMVISVIAGFQGGFMAAYTMTQGGPAGATTTLEYYIYNNAYQWLKMGYASAIAWILFLFVFIVTMVNWKYGGKRVNCC